MSAVRFAGRTTMIPLPDLLYPRPSAAVDERLLEELLELSFLGGDPGADITAAMNGVNLPPSPWKREFFAEGLFLEELVERYFRISLEGRVYPLHERFLASVLCHPPMDPEVVRYRQAILAELDGGASGAAGDVRRRAEALYRRLFDLLSLFKNPGSGRAGGMTAALSSDQASFRLEILRQVQGAIDAMVDDFAGCESGLARLHEVGLEIRDSPEYRTLAALLDHEDHLGELTLRVRLGADGRIRRLSVEELAENTVNVFHRSPLRRWADRVKLRFRGFDLDRREVVNRLIVAVYGEIAPTLRTILQLIGHLEVYLGALAFAESARRQGLEVTLAEIAGDGTDGLRIERLFNPLLLEPESEAVDPPVPCDLAPRSPTPTVIVTGPNSGGKTRLLQAVGIAQVLGQAGLFVAARRARLALVPGLFVSLIEQASAHQTEGRLGAELMRIRRLFEECRPGSMILLDELCSGTNPSEAVEIVSLVLDLLRGVSSTALITTHFLDYTRSLQAAEAGANGGDAGGELPGSELEFLRVVSTEDHVPTYQFTDGVAETSLASNTARRMGVTFDSLADLLVQRFGIERPRRHGIERPRRHGPGYDEAGGVGVERD